MKLSSASTPPSCSVDPAATAPSLSPAGDLHYTDFTSCYIFILSDIYIPSVWHSHMVWLIHIVWFIHIVWLIHSVWHIYIVFDVFISFDLFIPFDIFIVFARNLQGWKHVVINTMVDIETCIFRSTAGINYCAIINVSIFFWNTNNFVNR